MAMVHPDDTKFAESDPVPLSMISSTFEKHIGLTPAQITTPSSSQGLYHKIYFVRLPSTDPVEGGAGTKWAGKDVVFRLARRTIDMIKIQNEIAMLEVAKAAVPVPEVVFYNADPDNEILGFEYICLEKIPHPPLADTWRSLSSDDLNKVLDQMVDMFIKMWDLGLPGGGLIGSLKMNEGSKEVVSGPVLEEVMWQRPDIERYFHAEPYNLTSETFSTLNPTGSYATWVEYMSAFVKSYMHVITIHPNVSHLRDLLSPLQTLVSKLDAPSGTEEEFREQTPEPPKELMDTINSWPDLFLKRLADRSPSIVSDIQEFLRSCLEVGVRGWGNVDAGKGSWKAVDEESLKVHSINLDKRKRSPLLYKCGSRTNT